MKKLIYLLIPIVTVLSLFSCSIDNFSNQLKGFVDGYYKEELDIENRFQCYTDYQKYYYHDSLGFKNNSKYRVVTSEDIADINTFFEDWKRCYDRDKFDYDYKKHIKEGDYFHIYIEDDYIEDNIIDYYELYYFDTDENILYFVRTSDGCVHIKNQDTFE